MGRRERSRASNDAASAQGRKETSFQGATFPGNGAVPLPRAHRWSRDARPAIARVGLPRLVTVGPCRRNQGIVLGQRQERQQAKDRAPHQGRTQSQALLSNSLRGGRLGSAAHEVAFERSSPSHDRRVPLDAGTIRSTRGGTAHGIGPDRAQRRRRSDKRLTRLLLAEVRGGAVSQAISPEYPIDSRNPARRPIEKNSAAGTHLRAALAMCASATVKVRLEGLPDTYPFGV